MLQWWTHEHLRLLDFNHPALRYMLNHNNHRIAWLCVGDNSFKFLLYQLSIVIYWITMAFTDHGVLGYDSGERAWETARTSKEGSRRANFPNLNSRRKWQDITIGDCQQLSNWNEYKSKQLTRNNWRASLVPAAAVIPAPIAYLKVVAVKKLVVGLLRIV